jgi:hypothetical protein
MPCPECGAAVERTGAGHRCRTDLPADTSTADGTAADASPAEEPAQLAAELAAELTGVDAALEALEFEVQRYLATPEGRFETWLAARRVRRAR